MTDLEARLLENLDDDAAWLVYGDWLLEHDDVRGTLVQLERRLPASRDRRALEAEIAALVAKHQARWRETLPPEIDVVGWRHGFVTAIAITWSDDAPAQLARALELPVAKFVRCVRLGDPGGVEVDEEEIEDFENYTPPPIEAAALATLALGGATQLELPYVRIGDAGAQALATSPALANLEHLDLRYAGIGDDGIGALAASLPRVRRLHLQRNRIGPVGAVALARLGALVELDLRYNPLGAEGARALAAAPFLPQLARLALYRADVTADGARALATSQLAPSLRNYWRSL